MLLFLLISSPTKLAAADQSLHQARFRGTVLNPADKLSWNDKRWRNYVKNLAITGHDTIVIAWSSRNGLSLYPSTKKQLFPGLASPDLPGVILSEAARYGMHVVIGLDGTVRGEEMYANDFSPSLMRNIVAVDELLNRYISQPAFAGFLLPQEGTGMPGREEIALFSSLAKHVRDNAPEKIFALRVSRPKYRKFGTAANPALLGVRLMHELFNAAPDEVHRRLDGDVLFTDWKKSWRDALSAARPNVVIYSDGLGTHTSFPALSDYEIDALRTATDGTGAKLWVAAEIFDITPRPDDRTPASPHTAEFKTIATRLTHFAPRADMLLSYSFDFMDPESKTFPAERKRFFKDYANYLKKEFPALAAAAAKGSKKRAAAIPPPPAGAHGHAPDLLQNKALRVEEIIRSRHDVEGQVFTYRGVLNHLNHPENMWQEDSCWLTGILVAAESLRYAATGDPDARASAARSARALHNMANVTPVPGVVVRVFNRTMHGYQPDNPEKKRFYKDSTREMYYTADISRDQLSGYFFGLGLYHDLVADPAERVTISRDAYNIVKPIIENDMTSIEFDGTPTTYGSLTDSPLLGLDFLQVAYHITGRPEFRAKYLELTADRWLIRATENSATVYNHFFEHFDDSAYYTILAYETDKSLQRALFTGLDFLYTRARYNGNGHILGDMATYRPWSDAAAMAFTELMEFDPARNLFVGAWTQQIGAHQPRDKFVPMVRRRPQEYLWCWFPTSTITQGDAVTEFSGVDYLLTYWMGKYHGFGW